MCNHWSSENSDLTRYCIPGQVETLCYVSLQLATMQQPWQHIATADVLVQRCSEGVLFSYGSWLCGNGSGGNCDVIAGALRADLPGSADIPL